MFCVFYHPVYNFNSRVHANRAQWGTRSIQITRTARGCGSCVRDGPAAGQSRARAAYYICLCIARVCRQRVCVSVGAYGERGKRIILRGEEVIFCAWDDVAAVAWCFRYGGRRHEGIDCILYNINFVCMLYAHAIATKQSSHARLSYL